MKSFFTLILLSCFLLLNAENTVNKGVNNTLKRNFEYKYRSLIIPTILITYGAIGIESDELKLLNAEIKEEVNENIDEKFTIDDYSQYASFVSVFALNKFGVKGKHNLKDATLILGSSYLIMGASVLSLKNMINVKRPDGSSKNSFPSGHTATAFMGAEFLYQEYKHRSIWYGISGYTIAIGTGAFRMYNDRHWFTDVVAGAGFGILSTKISYMLHERIFSSYFSCEVNPYFDKKTIGLSLNF